MCSLLVLLGVDPEWPVLVGANRDEQRSRSSSPPGLIPGVRRRILAPRDARAGGTWIGINDGLWFAAITNVGRRRIADAASRGRLPLLALDQERFDDVPGALRAEVEARPYNGFQLLVTDGGRTWIARHIDSVLRIEESDARLFALSNDDPLHVEPPPALAEARAPGLPLAARLDVIARVLLDRGEHGGHRMLKDDGDYGTVSSSILALPRAGLAGVVWRYAAGPPDRVPYRDYGNLARRLAEG